MTEIPDAETMKAFNKGIVDEFRANGGNVGGPFEGATLLLLTTTGVKSGQPRLAPLAYLTIDGKMIIIGSKAGAETNPDWVHNLRANPHAHIEMGIRTRDPEPVGWIEARSSRATLPALTYCRFPRKSANATCDGERTWTNPGGPPRCCTYGHPVSPTVAR